MIVQDKQLDLFAPITRDQRQEECRVAWIKNKCRGTIVACTGFGKTRVALNCIKTVLNKYPEFKIIVVVPTTALWEQWTRLVDLWGFTLNTQIFVVNTLIKSNYKCDLLIIDEEHRFANNIFQNVFECVKYRMILGLTATFERLDGGHEILSKYCPVVDTITLQEAKFNGWVSEYTEYQVLITVNDIEHYIELDQEFHKHFEFFNNDFNLLNSMVGKDGLHNRLAYRDKICISDDKTLKSEVLKDITYHATSAMKYLQARKKFIYNHPEKIRVAQKIIEARKNAKIITFSGNIAMAESIGGPVYSGKDSKKKGRLTLDEFSTASSGVLNTIQKCNEGLDVPGLSVAIILGLDSSKIKATQRTGRAVRKEENKVAEIFNIIILDTVETKWFSNSHTAGSYVTINEEGLDKVLSGQEPDVYKAPIPKIMFRF